MNKDYTVKELNSWQEFKTYIGDLSDNWLFRGQSDSSWELQSSFERAEFSKIYNGIEPIFVLDFQRAAKNFLELKDIPENLIEWLAMMQHHGAPTRLIDFTKSPYIGAYFAFENIAKDINSIAVWAINSELISTKNSDINYFDHSVEASRMNKPIELVRFEKMFSENNQRFIIPIEPFIMNKRYYLQQSVFISPANTDEPFMDQLDFLEEDIQKAVVKIVLPASIKNEVLRDLQKLNINRASLFPDLDGYSQSLKIKYDSMLSMKEYINQRKEFIGNDKYGIHP